MSYRTFEPNLTIAGQKINPLSDIMNLGIQTTGNVVFVKDPGDADYRTVREAVGRENIYDTIQAAIDSPKVRDGLNDYVVVCPIGLCLFGFEKGVSSQQRGDSLKYKHRFWYFFSQEVPRFLSIYHQNDNLMIRIIRQIFFD